ncbi:H+transporting two-sector ATPase E subunit [Parasphaerochaeta coccoides]|uniref:V-type ATP synthase subunit E n=1 Tax=Parasphaerochaeta coccoides (strain ATCC BAA-1237 / DSM 17374 / SPN1) TaxID=760011 RepID=F4GLL3_PARC1|nr:H+transporting two-sector ATPase E subunit [Parasphaerochaeta coccoides]AEC01983.1 H+transporting two-sector ATPase E subunit [Parasphaerochaeta coccoides DSM 17374]
MTTADMNTDIKVRDSVLLSGIMKEAQDKADRIVEAAQAKAKVRILQAQEQAKKQCHDERTANDMRIQTVHLQIESARRNILRKAQLLKQDRYRTQVMDKVKELLYQRVHEKGFSAILTTWIAEATVGLGVSEAKVAYSEETPVTEKILHDAERLVREKTGFAVTLALDERRLGEPGIRVTSLDDAISFSNHISDRLRRFDREIKNLVDKRTCRTE